MKKEELVKVHLTQSQSFYLIRDDGSVMIFEGGWWMDKSDWRKVWIENRKWHSNYRKVRNTPNPRVGLDRNENTRKITIFFLPLQDEDYY